MIWNLHKTEYREYDKWFVKVSDFDFVILWKPFILKFDREVERQMHNDQWNVFDSIKKYDKYMHKIQNSIVYNIIIQHTAFKLDFFSVLTKIIYTAAATRLQTVRARSLIT